MIKNIIRLFEYFPTPLNKFLIGLNRNDKIIYGSRYHQYKNFINKNFYHYDNTKQLIKIVNYAIKNIPYYQNNNHINSIESFQRNIDFIDKDTISYNFKDMLSKKINLSDYEIITTGGTGGQPLKLYVPKDRYVIELGTMHMLWRTVGFKHNIRAVIRNKRLDESQDYIINPVTKEIIFDGFRLNEKYFQTIYNTLVKFKIHFIHAYPSTAYEFSKFLYNKKLQTSFIKAFLSGSENVYDYQKKFIEEKLHIRFYNWYGHSEKLILGGYCKNHDIYHIEPTYGFFELIDTNGNIITQPGKVGEIVGTSLHNYGMPLIRYKTDDYAEYVGNYCKYCKRHIPLIKNIQGRRTGLKIYGADGEITTTTALNFHDDLYLFIAGLQYIQKKKGILDILIIKGQNFTNEHDIKIKQYYKSKFSKNTKINIKYVTQLQRKPNGKFVELISTIKE